MNESADPDEIRRWGYAAVDLMVDHLTGLTDRPVFQPMSAADRNALTGMVLPASPVPFEDLLAFVRDQVLTHPMGYGHPRFFGWASSGVQPEAVLAELWAATANFSCAGGDHAATYLEQGTIAWMGELLGLPRAGGLLVAGGSMAALTALAAARHRAAVRDGWDDRFEGFTSEAARRFVLYLSSEAHSCNRKAARLLGLGDRGVRVLGVDGVGRLDVDEHAAVLAADRAAGLRPFAVVLSSGTVNTGAVDPIGPVVDLCGGDPWVHVDGSLGAIARLDPDRAPLFAGIEGVDWVAFDPHKWLSVPIDCALLLVRRPDDLRDTFSLVPPYLRTEFGRGFGGPPWFAEHGLDQTRPFRALKLWAAVAAVGRDELARRIAQDHRRADRFAAEVAATDGFEIVSPPVLSSVLFRCTDGDDLDELNREVALSVQEQGDIFLTSTWFAGVEALRVAFMDSRSTEADVERIIPAVRRAATLVRDGPGGGAAR